MISPTNRESTLVVEIRYGEEWQRKTGETFKTLKGGLGVLIKTYKELTDGTEEQSAKEKDPISR